MPHQGLLDLYGLPRGDNPYAPRVLDPMKEPGHSKLILCAEPFDVLSQVDVYLNQCIKQGTTAFILVTGESGTGRSSVANAILASYRAQVVPDSDKRMSRFFLPAMPMLNEDPFSIYSKWVYNFRNALYFSRTSLGPPPDNFFADLDKVYDARTKDDYASKFQQVLGEFSLLLRNQGEPAGFGLLMEGVPNPSFIHVAKEIFLYARGVCVFTVSKIKPEVISTFSNAFSEQPPHLVRLEGICGEIVRKLLVARWNGANSHPFDDAGVQQAFKQPIPIGKVLYIVSALLDVRAHEKSGSPPWPGNPGLRFTREDLLWGVEFFSKSWRQT